MTRLAFKDFFPETFPIVIDPIEVDHVESIPTFYLLQNYQKKHPEYQFWFVMGTDLIEGLHWWDDGERLINEQNFLIFERPGYDQNKLQSHANWPKNYKLAYGSNEKHKNLLGGIMT